MKKRSILLFCDAGMSTSIMVKKMQNVCDEHDMPFIVSAHPIAKLIDVVEEKNPVIVLLGPQVKFLKDKTNKQLEKYNLAVDVIDSALYGAMNGEEVMKNVIRKLKEKKDQNE